MVSCCCGRLWLDWAHCRPMKGLMTHVTTHDFVLTYRVLHGELLGLGLDWQWVLSKLLAGRPAYDDGTHELTGDQSKCVIPLQGRCFDVLFHLYFFRKLFLKIELFFKALCLDFGFRKMPAHKREKLFTTEILKKMHWFTSWQPLNIERHYLWHGQGGQTHLKKSGQQHISRPILC